MSDQYRRDYEHEGSARRWSGSKGRGITRESGWDRGGRGRDERDSRDWQQRVDESQQGYRTRDPMFDRDWHGETWQGRRHSQSAHERGPEGGAAPGGGWPWGGGAHESAWPNYAGRGPKGYKRSDDRIREEISDRLMQDHAVDATDIEVLVKDGEVTFSGTVTSRDQKRRAEELAERCNGVSEITNNLRLSRSTTTSP
jgi:hypothetical protein